MGGGMDYEPDPEPVEIRCHHVKDDGNYCGRFPKSGEPFCPAHKVDDSES